jgi:hypothetical protein
MTRNLALAALAVGLMSLSAVAQDASVLDDLYGRGVHAYNSRDSRKAVELLTEAIDSGSQDARAFYYRGLALRNLGREEDAALDFQAGAKMEQAGPELVDIVSKSLERVQGSVRLEIEGYRRVARLKTRNDRLAGIKRRYEEISKEDETVVRKPAGVKPTTRPPAVLPEATRPDESDPFGGEDAPKKPAVDKPESTEDAPAETPEPADEGDAPPPKPKPAKPAADPFGDEPAEEMPEDEAPPKPKPAKPAKPAADPFGDDADAPAADAPEEEMPEDEKPAKPAKPDEAEAPDAAATPPAAKPGKAGRSLFGALGKAFLGDDTGKPAAAKPAAGKPAVNPADVKDPFADDEEPAPAAKPAKPAPKKPAAPADIEDPFK